MKLQDYIQRAQELQCYEILFVSDATARSRLKNAWFNMTDKVLTAQECRQVILPILTDSDLKDLKEKSSAKGFWYFEGNYFFYSIQIASNGLTAHLSWVPEKTKTPEFWGFPLPVKESLVRSGGLHLLVAKDKLAQEAAAFSIMENINQSTQKYIVWNKSQALVKLKSKQSIISYIGSKEISEAADIVVVEGFESREMALHLAERGQSVLWLLNYGGPLSQVLQKLGAGAWCDQLKWAMSIKLIHGLEGLVAAYDLLFASAKVKELLQKNEMHNLEQWMGDAGHNEGMRTMNQALLQLVLKRKIDFKQGFEESPKPDQFDLLLKKVGI